jgi:hypothetical protein
MFPNVPETKAQSLANELYEGTGTVSRDAMRLKEIAMACRTLGMPVGDELMAMSHDLSNAARRSASAFGGYIHAQSNGTLYHAPDLSDERAALGLQ